MLSLSQNSVLQKFTLPLRATHDRIGCLQCTGRMRERARRTVCKAVSDCTKSAAQRAAQPSRCCNTIWPSHDGNTTTDGCPGRCRECRQDCCGVSAQTDMWNGDWVLEPSHGWNSKSGTTSSGPGTYLMSSCIQPRNHTGAKFAGRVTSAWRDSADCRGLNRARKAHQGDWCAKWVAPFKLRGLGRCVRHNGIERQPTSVT